MRMECWPCRSPRSAASRLPGGNAEVSQVPGEVQLLELAEGDFLEAGGQVRRLVSLVDLFRGGAPERNDYLP